MTYEEFLETKKISHISSGFTVKERALVTDGLRYKILKRDNFKCKACGKSASEVELQIDHIIPVSKGGKTIESNLQALCKKCNSGKSNKY